tara:strand:+ start:2409 stop:2999 length:591 start_codon:yes stop_codon:yes gene_type:complete
MFSCNSSDCTNGIQDGNETGVDCGGNCPNCLPPLPASSTCGTGSFAVNGSAKTHNGLVPGLNFCMPGSLVSLGQTPSEILAANVTLVNYSAIGVNEFTLQLTVSDGNGMSVGMPYSADINMDPQVSISYFGGGGETWTNASSLNNTVNGTVTFSEIDISNLLISGTFSFTGYGSSNPSDSIVVTNGTFQDIPITVQ